MYPLLILFNNNLSRILYPKNKVGDYNQQNAIYLYNFYINGDMSEFRTNLTLRSNYRKRKRKFIREELPVKFYFLFLNKIEKRNCLFKVGS